MKKVLGIPPKEEVFKIVSHLSRLICYSSQNSELTLRNAPGRSETPADFPKLQFFQFCMQPREFWHIFMS